MRISDWISGVCSTDLDVVAVLPIHGHGAEAGVQPDMADAHLHLAADLPRHGERRIGIARQRGDARGVDDQLRTGPGDLEDHPHGVGRRLERSEEHTSELQSLMRISYAVFCLKKTKQRHPGRNSLM